MSSLFFTCQDKVESLPDQGLREDALTLLEHARTCRPSEMEWLYSRGQSHQTMAASEWAWQSQLGLRDVGFWRGTGMSTRLYDALVEDRLEDHGMMRAARLPFVHEYVQAPCLAFASGSHLYGFASRQSDWDVVVLVSDLPLLKTDDSEPFFRFYTPSLLFQDAKRGLRHAWELLTAPKEAQMTWDTNLEETRQQALQTLSRTAIPWRLGSKRYFDTWYPRFFIKPEDEADPSIKRWKMKRGWPYKLGYYIAIDLYLSSLAQKSGRYQTTITDMEIISVLCRMKQGEMALQEWLDLIAPLLPPGCDLKDSRGKLPVEFQEVSANDRDNSQVF